MKLVLLEQACIHRQFVKNITSVLLLSRRYDMYKSTTKVRMNMYFPENLSHQHLYFSPSKIVVNIPIHYEKNFNYLVACKKENANESTRRCI